jgi:hypothetical protein
LRPLRSVETHDYLAVMSEAGQIDFPPTDVLKRGRIEAGGMLYFDHSTGETYDSHQVMDRLAKEKNYTELLAQRSVHLSELPKVELSELNNEQVEALKKYQDQLEGKTTAEMAQDMFTETQRIANNTESTAKALTIGMKRVSFGRQDNLEDGINPVVKLIKTVGEFRKTQAELAKDPNFIKGEVNKALGLVDIITKPLEAVVDDMIIEFKKLNQELKKTLRSPKTSEQEKIDIENKKREEASKPKNNDNAYMFNANLKVTHVGLENTLTVQQTEKGYLTPMINMSNMS